ncbi:sodium-dependent transporter [Clostridium thermopalmarium]|uniref:Transporter n=1 Tax=Clostridium thermopalmarium DSM 5974 TaxID=1121340 RepID=A0A2T0AQV4_9CLOT|nr:sodium-dependent transporter [Clostridium thermopalmarium]PRR71830.1 Sodium:neurotransmitter symporter family protein [Clostridium thermopalmarium DSM 5974]PVZ21349.1 NSS family neurotransmitter:Na+ symporter [Clostridium thermopalmarium DSM 5974]
MKNNKGREGFSSGLAAFFATLGSAVGLGNIWKFPYVVGSNGGAAFLLVYFICIIFVGLPVMISEFYMGRKTRKSVVGAVQELNSHKKWRSIGISSILSSYFIVFFYSAVGGWVYSYVFRAIKGDFNEATAENVQVMFMDTITNPVSAIAWQLVVIAVVSIILASGVKNGIERITKTLMPILFVLILVCDVRALTLPGVKDSFKFLFKVDFSMLTQQGILVAMGLAFFKMSLGMGTMTTYGSYFTEKDNMMSTAAKVAISDTIVSLLVGIAVFGAVFSFNMEPTAGPGLLFMTVPLVFGKLPFGSILLVVFFILSSIAATTAMISMCEVAIAYFVEQKGFSRKKAVLINAIIILIFGIPAALSADASGVLGGITVFGKTLFDLFDYVSSNILLPLGGLIIAIFIGYTVPKKDIEKELSNQGAIEQNKLINFYYFILRYVTPVLVFIVFLSSIGVFDKILK